MKFLTIKVLNCDAFKKAWGNDKLLLEKITGPVDVNFIIK